MLARLILMLWKLLSIFLYVCRGKVGRRRGRVEALLVKIIGNIISYLLLYTFLVIFFICFVCFCVVFFFCKHMWSLKGRRQNITARHRSWKIYIYAYCATVLWIFINVSLSAMVIFTLHWFSYLNCYFGMNAWGCNTHLLN